MVNNISSSDPSTLETSYQLMIEEGRYYDIIALLEGKSDKSENEIVFLVQAFRNKELYENGLSLIENTPATDRLAQASLMREKSYIYWVMSELEKSYTAISEAEKLLNECKEFNDKFLIVKADILHTKGNLCYTSYDLNCAEDYYKESLEIRKKLNRKLDIAITISNLGAIENVRGSNLQSLKLYHEGLKIKKGLGNDYSILLSYGNIGRIYWSIGDIKNSLKFDMLALDLSKKVDNTKRIAGTLQNLVLHYLSTGNVELAKKYYDELKSQGTTVLNKYTSFQLKISKALMLKYGSRTRDKVQAQIIFEKLLKDPDLDSQMRTDVMIYLCDILIGELSQYGSKEVLDEIIRHTSELFHLADISANFKLIIEVLLLKSKLSMVSKDISKSVEFADQALVLSIGKGFAGLEKKAELQKNEILQSVKRWEKLIEKESSIRDRLEESKLQDYLNRVLLLKFDT